VDHARDQNRDELYAELRAVAGTVPVAELTTLDVTELLALHYRILARHRGPRGRPRLTVVR
jgi:hypothetical protein